MKRITHLFIALCMSFYCSASNQVVNAGAASGTPAVVVEKNDTDRHPMRLHLAVIDQSADAGDCEKFIAQVKQCLEYDGTFAVDLAAMKHAPNKKHGIQKLFNQGYDCAIFLTFFGEKKPVEWRLYDTMNGVMVRGKRQQEERRSGRTGAQSVAASIMHELTGVRPPFVTKIAYRKRDPRTKKTMLCISDFDGTQEKILVSSKTKEGVIVAPTWNNDPGYPCIIFSEFRPSNVSLMVTDLKGRKRSILDIDGTTVGVSYAPYSDEVAYCRSGMIWHYYFDTTQHKAIHKLIIREAGTCASPQLLESGDIIYCCAGKIKRYYAADKSKAVITPEGYCVGPSYSSKGEKVVYSRRVDGYMQLFVYDIASGKHKQMTFGSKNSKSKDFRAHKVDPCWAPDGVTVAFAWEREGASRVACMNTLTGEYRFITSESEHCSYPAWSGYFDQLGDGL